MSRPAHRAPRRLTGPMIAAICAAGALLLTFILVLAVGGNGNSSPAGNGTPTTATGPVPTPPGTSPSPTGIDPTNLDETPTESASPSTATATVQATAATPKPLNTGNGSGCDVGTKFQAQLLKETVDRNVGAEFKGTVCLKKNESIWAFNFDMNRSLYILASGKTDKPAPIVADSGVWSWNDFEVDSDTIVNFVLADGTCSNWIAGQDPNADFGNRIVLNDVQRNGCQVIAYKQITAVS
jgi:hypothetical protein